MTTFEENKEFNEVEPEDQEIQLTADDILNFEFPIDYKGYSPIEVDQLLDVVMNDYALYEEMVEQLTTANQDASNTINDLLAKINSLSKELEETKKQLSEKVAKEEKPEVNPFAEGTNADLLRRISRLEAAVFGGRNQ